MNIGAVAIGGANPCAIIAELSNAHNGKLQTAIRLLDAAKAVGASAAKLQCYSVEELIALRGDGPAPAPWNDQTMRELYARAMTPRDWFPTLYDHAASIGLPVFSSVFGIESLELLESLGNVAYKIARLDNQEAALRSAVLATGKPVLASYGHRDRLSAYGNVSPIYCPESYPTPSAGVHLPNFGGPSGYLGISSHCMDPLLPIAAVARGAALIEMHFQLDDEPSELEQNISLTASQFAQMIADVRAVEVLLAH